MAAIDTPRGQEYVTLQCEHLWIPEGNLSQMDRGQVGFVDIHGRTGVSGLLPASDPRVSKAQGHFGSLSAHDIERHNSYMARTSHESAEQVYWAPNSTTQESGEESFLSHIATRSADAGWNWPTWDRDKGSVAYGEGVDSAYGRPHKAEEQRQEESFASDVAYPTSEFFGIMLDSGSTTSVVSERQLQAYRNWTGYATTLQPLANARLSSMHGSGRILGLSEFRFPFADSFRSFHARVSNGDSPLILGLSDHRRLGMNVCSISNTVTMGDGSILPLKSMRGHLFLVWKPAAEETLYTTPELKRLHRRFGHPSTEKLIQFLERCDADQIDSQTSKTLEQIAKSCNGCQRSSKAPVRFRVSIPSDMFEFNREVIVDLFTINKRTAISFVDRDTRFSVCRFMPANNEVKAKDVWRMLLTAWVFPYSGYPDTLRHDRGTQFIASELQVVAAEAGISAASVGIESANAMGIGERIHGPIRRTFEKLLADHPDFDDHDFLLMAATKSYNDMQGVNGLVPTLLVFGVYPKIPLPGSSDHAVPNHVRLRVMKTAREEYRKIVDEMRLKEAIRPDRPTPSLPVGLTNGTSVLVYRTNTARWEHGTFLYEAGSLVYVRLGSRVQPFSREKVKIAIHGEDYGDDDGRLNIFDVPDEPVQPSGVQQSDVPDFDPDSIPQLADLPSLAFEEENADPRIFYTSPQAPQVDELNQILEDCLATEVIANSDPRSKTFDKAIQLELSGLLEKGVFQEACIPPEDRKKLNILRSRFVLALKEPGTEQEKHKARLVVQAIPQVDRDRPFLFTYAPTVTKASFRILLSLAASKGFDVYLRDISQAYCCSEFELIREAYIIPPKSLNLPKNVLWKLMKPLYGLPESGLLWYETYRSYHEVDLQMKASVVDPCVYYRQTSDDLSGMIVTQVDDSAIIGTASFLAQEDKVSPAFPSKGRHKVEQCGKDFNGSKIAKSGTGFSMDQSAYISRINNSKVERKPEAYATLKGKLHYASSNTRPDLSCAINLLSQTLAQDATETEYKELDRVNQEMHETPLSLQYRPLDLDSLELCVYSDASFANCLDNRSQIGYTVFLRDKNGTCALISWGSSKSKRVTRSVLAAELFALSHSYDVGFALRFTVSELIGRDIPMRLYTDSKTLFQSVTNLTSMTEKRLLIDIASLRDAYRNGDLAHLAHIDTADNPADAMTKSKPTNTLAQTLRSCRLQHKTNLSVGTGKLPTR